MAATASPTRALPRSRWVAPEPVDPLAVARLRAELNLPEIICRLLVSRGHAGTLEAKGYLRPRLAELHDPSLITGVDKAAERLSRAIQLGETVLVHGDYDVDGMCSTVIMVETLTALGGKAIPFIPRRVQDGYDLSAAGVGAARSSGATVVLTCDCGTSAHGAVGDLTTAGVDVIIADHHLPSGPLPDALCVLNPKQPGCGSTDRDLAAAGVAFKLALSLTRLRGGSDEAVFGLLDLVALATIADVAPLRGENRVLVRHGLRLLNNSRRLGVQALIRACGMAGKPLTAGRVGFILAPRLNAAGRLAHGLRGVELLQSASEHEANVIARELEELNARRQDLDRWTLDRARSMLEHRDLASTYGIVLAERGWHPGVIGIVASRLVEEYGRPTILIAIDGNEGKGSGRSIAAFDLHAGLVSCRDVLRRFGGHRAAAGVTIDAARIDEFAERFNAAAAERLTDEDLVPRVRTDLEVSFEDLTDELERLLRHLEPCGIANPAPVFVTRSVVAARPPRVVGKDGLKIVLRQGDREVHALGWGLGGRAAEVVPGRPMDVAYRLERDEWNGESRLQARLIDFHH